MRYRPIAPDGTKVSVIGVGTWQWGGEWGRDVPQADADAVLDRAAALGINLIDTAECYGDHKAEAILGDYLARHDRSRWFVATKFGHRFQSFMKREDAFDPDAVRQQFEDSLRALRTDYVDLYQFHSGADAQFDNEALWTMLRGLRDAGKIRHLGVSILGKGSAHQAKHAAEVGAEALQVVYNRLDRRPESYVFPLAREHRLGVLARVPLASGLLTGKFREPTVFPPNDVRATFNQADWEMRRQEAARLLETEVPPDMPMSVWSLAWCLRRVEVTAVIPGARNVAQLEQNAKAADVPPYLFADANSTVC